MPRRSPPVVSASRTLLASGQPDLSRGRPRGRARPRRRSSPRRSGPMLRTRVVSAAGRPCPPLATASRRCRKGQTSCRYATPSTSFAAKSMSLVDCCQNRRSRSAMGTRNIPAIAKSFRRMSRRSDMLESRQIVMKLCLRMPKELFLSGPGRARRERRRVVQRMATPSGSTLSLGRDASRLGTARPLCPIAGQAKGFLFAAMVPDHVQIAGVGCRIRHSAGAAHAPHAGKAQAPGRTGGMPRISRRACYGPGLIGSRRALASSGERGNGPGRSPSVLTRSHRSRGDARCSEVPHMIRWVVPIWGSKDGSQGPRDERRHAAGGCARNRPAARRPASRRPVRKSQSRSRALARRRSG